MLQAIGLKPASSPAQIDSAMDSNWAKQIQELTEMEGMPRI